MPQTFQVLKCYSCHIFQIHPTKKSNKFECKVCGEKQSIKRHYGLGTGKECRIHVQKLNGIRESMNETSSQEDVDIDEFEHTNDNKYLIDNHPKKESKWLEYVDKNDVEINDSMYLGDAEVVLDVPKKLRKYDRNKNFKTNKDTVETNDLYDDISKPYGKMLFEVKENLEHTSTTEENNKIDPSLSQVKTANNKFKKNPTQSVINESSKWAQYTKTTNEDIVNYISNDLNKEGELIDCNNREKKYATKKFKSLKSALDNRSLQFSNTERKLPFISKQSKWARYTNDAVIKQDLGHQNSPTSLHPLKSNRSNSSNTQLFSLCDDSDLDNVLDI